MKHQEIPIKVNAWVDRGVAPLVEAMNCFKTIWTTDSCQGNGQFARVHFAFCGSNDEFAAFIEMLSRGLGDRMESDGDYRITLEWTPGAERPLGAVFARQGIVQPLSNAIRLIALSYDHKNRSQRDTNDRALRSLTNRRARRRSAR